MQNTLVTTRKRFVKQTGKVMFFVEELDKGVKNLDELGENLAHWIWKITRRSYSVIG